ncbi:MAG: hypothetical protein ACOX5F_01035 [Anaerovoracaceae bacterium]|jgi:hypothetical protein
MATKKKAESVVRAVTSFMDARTGRDYHPGDIVVGWDDVRAEHYAGAGLVEVIEMPYQEVEDTPKPKTTTRKKPGPSTTKLKASTEEDR